MRSADLMADYRRYLAEGTIPENKLHAEAVKELASKGTTLEDLEAREIGTDAWRIAKKLMEADHFATLNGSEEVYVYKEGVYVEGGEALIKRRVQKFVSNTRDVTAHLVNEVEGHVQRSTFISRGEFNTEGPVLVVENGLLDTETNQTAPHRADFYSMSKLPVIFDPSKDCQLFKAFLSQVLYSEDIAVLQEWFGYCLHRGYPAQVAILFVGDGNNGKSTLLSVLKSFLGVDNISAVSLQELETNRFAKVDLFGKLANIYADLPDSALQSVGTFKMLTGGDPIRGEKKFHNSFPFVNFAKLTFSCNVVPEVHEDTTAFFRRWIIIQFPHAFEGALADKGLLKKLTTPDELSGVLNWALEGLKRLRDNGWTFSNSKSTEDVRLDYIRRSSPMKAFLLDCTKQESSASVAKQALFEAFVHYCKLRKLPVVTSDTFFKNLPLYFPGRHLEESREGPKGKRVRYFLGLGLRPSEEWGKALPEEEEEEGLKEAEG